MAIADQDLEIQRGDNERLLAVIDPASAAADLYFTVKKRLRDADEDAIISKSSGEGIAITVAGNESTPAQVQIAIDAADTQAPDIPNRITPPVQLFYDLTDGAGHTIARGKLTVLPEVRLGG
jgi:hypothetical protein